MGVSGHTTTYTSDAANRLKSVVQVNSRNTSADTTAYSYDSLGNLGGFADANSHITQNLFDQLREMTAKTQPDGTLTETRSS